MKWINWFFAMELTDLAVCGLLAVNARFLIERDEIVSGLLMWLMSICIMVTAKRQNCK